MSDAHRTEDSRHNFKPRAGRLKGLSALKLEAAVKRPEGRGNVQGNPETRD